MRHAAHRVEHPDVGVAHEREQVAVARGDLDRLPAARRERRDDVLGLEAVGADDRDPERAQHLAADPLLRRDGIGLVVGPRHAMGLVGWQRVDAEGGPPVVVDRDAERRRLAVADQPRQHR